IKARYWTLTGRRHQRDAAAHGTEDNGVAAPTSRVRTAVAGRGANALARTERVARMASPSVAGRWARVVGSITRPGAGVKDRMVWCGSVLDTGGARRLACAGEA